MCSPLGPPMVRSRDNRQRLPKQLKTWPKPISLLWHAGTAPSSQWTSHGRGSQPARATSTMSITPLHAEGLHQRVARGGGTWQHA